MLIGSCKAPLSSLQSSGRVTHVSEGTALTGQSQSNVKEAREHPREGKMPRERQFFCWMWGLGMVGRGEHLHKSMQVEAAEEVASPWTETRYLPAITFSATKQSAGGRKPAENISAASFSSLSVGALEFSF